MAADPGSARLLPSTNSRSTRSGPSRWMRSRRRRRDIPARRWGWRPSAIRCGPGSCATTPTAPTGPTAIASCCRSATHPCSFIRCCTFPACARSTLTAGIPASRRSASTISSTFGSSTPKTPGHPEYRVTTGVEATTGPLGQGCGNSVGMAIAERWLAAHFNRDGAILFDHDVYALCSDGDMMEGVASEAASLAGHLKLANLCWIYDNNHITIEGGTPLAFSESVAERFRGYGWNVLHVADANDLRRGRAGARDVPANRGCADPDRRRQRHRLGLAGRRHRQGA